MLILTNKQIRFFVLSVFCIFFALTGCSLKEIKEQTQEVGNVGYIQGKIKVESDEKGTVVVLRFRDENGVPIKESRVIASKNGEYSFPVTPGFHYIAAFIDANNDNKYQHEEHGNYHGHPTKIVVPPHQTVTIDTIEIKGQVLNPDTEVKEIDRTKSVWRNIGAVVTMDDPRFTRDNYDMGLWKPFDFIEHAEGGLLFLHEYQKGKMPVIFVHGVMGGPTDFESVIKSLDNKYFQPWVLYYPSGLRLDMVSYYLVEAVEQLQNKYGFNQFYVVAHSMGGLVARSFVKKYVERSPDYINKLRLVMTINSPMNGMSAAASGVKYSPIVVPSWLDVEPGSEFLKGIHSWNWPKEIPYHLVISYTDGESGDSVVPLQSQSQPKLQSESTRMYIFNNNHVGTLNDKGFLQLFNMILSERIEN
jgi:hypothetical protein